MVFLYKFGFPCNSSRSDALGTSKWVCMHSVASDIGMFLAMWPPMPLLYPLCFIVFRSPKATMLNLEPRSESYACTSA